MTRENEMLLPDFLVMGPPKTASSSLQYYLSQHPGISMSPKKDTRFFGLDYEKGMSFYANYFSDAREGTVIGEATPSYSFLPFVASRIKKEIPGAKLIFTFRNPVERAYSGWLMRKGAGGEKLGFIDALMQNLKQRESVDFFSKDFPQIWMEDQLVLNKKNKITLRTYIEAGLYSEQLKTYQKYFPASQIHILFMEDLARDLQGTLKSIFSFIKVSEDYELENDTIKNSYGKSRLKILNNFLGKEKLSKIARVLPSGIKNKILSLAKVNDKKPVISNREYQFAYQIFKTDIEALEVLLNKNLDHWKL